MTIVGRPGCAGHVAHQAGAAASGAPLKNLEVIDAIRRLATQRLQVRHRL